MLFVVLTLTACVSTGNSVGSKSSFKEKRVSFESEEGSLSITNRTNQDVIVLVGRAERNIVLGGIKSNDRRSFNLGKLPNIPKNCSLLVRIAPYKVYKEKGRIDERDVVYTRLVVYDSVSRKSKVFLDIPKEIDMEQKHCVYITNTSAFVLEVRDESSMGEVIATLPPLVSNERIYLLPRGDGMPYDLFPSFTYVHPRRMEVTTMRSSREDRMRVSPEPSTGTPQMIQFWAPSKYVVPYDVAFINIENKTLSSFQFCLAKTILKNQKGLKVTTSGRTDVYELSAGDSINGRLYSELFFEFDNFTRKSISPYSFKPGYEYKITVTEMNGNYQYEIRELGQKSLVEDARIELWNE